MIVPREEHAMPETLLTLLAKHRAGSLTPVESVKGAYAALRAVNDPAIFITLRAEAEAMAEAEALMTQDKTDLPLYGIPFAVKDNIDVAGLPTTAACKAFAHLASEDATSVARLRAAGAIVIGKTNLDQFATGLVGVRSPYGIPRNAMKPDLVPGGSSSGSAVAVAQGIVPFALGTDTAGSGRVPAGLNNIVGLKPTVGLVPSTGMVPACKTLDCTSVFTLTAEDALHVLQVMAGPDGVDSLARLLPMGALQALPASLTLGVPRKEQRVFFGDSDSEAAYDHALALVEKLGVTLVEVDMTAFHATADLLYDGPWVAERTWALGDYITKTPELLHPVTRGIVSKGIGMSAVATFDALYRLADLKAKAHAILAPLDGLLVPTAPTAYTLADLEREPVLCNTRNGVYTNFVNLLDLSGIAVPSLIAANGTPYGVTFLGKAGADGLMASLGAAFQRLTGLSLGATGLALPPLPAFPSGPQPHEYAIAVVGAHLAGQPLNHQLTSLGGRLLEATTTSDDYRLYALGGGGVARPGLVRVAPGKGALIRLEIWALPLDKAARFIVQIPPPLGIGTLTLADGRKVQGFLCEGEALKEATDITAFGGWIAYRASL